MFVGADPCVRPQYKMANSKNVRRIRMIFGILYEFALDLRVKIPFPAGGHMGPPLRTGREDFA